MIFDSVKKEWSGLPMAGCFNSEASLGMIVLNILARSPEKVAEINADTGEELTCKELSLRIVRVAQNFVKMGYKKGDLIGILLRNQINVSSLVMGAMCMGIKMIGLDPSYNVDDLAHMLKFTKPILMICEENNLETARKSCEKISLSSKFIVYGPASGDATSFFDLLKPTGDESTFIPPYLGDSRKLVGFMCCSSGTTGPAKAVCLSHAQMIEQNSAVVNQGAGPILNFSTLYWISGMTVMIKSLMDGMCRISSTKNFDPDVTFDLIEKYKIQILFIPGRYISALTHHPRIKTANLSSMRLMFTAGVVLSEDLRTEMERYMPNGKVINNYALSEAGGAVSSDFIKRRKGTCGLLAPNINVKIVDENGFNVGPEEKGEICLRYSFPFLGYYNDKEATEKCYKDGWLHTGDVGYFDEDNFLSISDRKKEVFKYMGYQIFPAELEEIIEKHEAVKSACVTYIHDPIVLTDLPAAVVELKPGKKATEDEILEFSNNQIVTYYKKLKGGLYIIDHMPETMSGKIVRRLAQEIAIKEFNRRRLEE